MREQFNLLTTYRVHYQLSETVVARQTDRGDFPGRPICPVQSEVNHYVVSATKPQTITDMMQYEWGGGKDYSETYILNRITQAQPLSMGTSWTGLGSMGRSYTGEGSKKSSVLFRSSSLSLSLSWLFSFVILLSRLHNVKIIYIVIDKTFFKEVDSVSKLKGGDKYMYIAVIGNHESN